MSSAGTTVAEAYLQRLGGEHIHVESAGLESAESVNPLVIEVMKEEGFDLSGKKTQRVFDLFKEGKLFDHTITVCSDTEQKCPVFPGITQRWHAPFPDPSQATGSREEQLARVREIRDMIKKWVYEPRADDFVAKVQLIE